MAQDPECIFCKISKGEIPSSKLYEDEKVFAVPDIHPHAPVHLLIIPHEHVPTLNDLPESAFDLIGHVFKVAVELAKRHGVAEQGYKLMHNVNDWGGQRLYHLHFHLLGGKQFGF